MRITLTGGTGFLGRAIIKALLDSGVPAKSITALTRHPSELLTSWGVQHHPGSILNPHDLQAAFKEAELIYHLAGQVSRDPAMAHDLHDVHVTGTRNVMDAAVEHRIKRVVYASTSGTVGCNSNPDVIATHESHYCLEAVARWPYYVTKIQAEQEVMARAERGELDVICLNPSLLLGPGDTGHSSTDDIRQFLDGKVPTVPRGGLSLVDVRDAAQAFVNAATRGESGVRYLLGAGNLSIAAFFELLESLSGVSRPRLRLPGFIERLGVDMMSFGARLLGTPPAVDRASVEMAQTFWYIDSELARTVLGFNPRPIRETIAATIDDIRAEH